MPESKRQMGWWLREAERRQLLQHLRHWLAGSPSDSNLSLSRDQIQIAASALDEALSDLPKVRKRLDAVLKADAEAHSAIRDAKGKDGVYAAARIKGWIPAKGGKAQKYPTEEFALELQYLALTTQSGQVTIGGDVAAATDLDEYRTTFDGCPLEPMDAIKKLTELYGAASEGALLKELCRRRKAIEERRREYLLSKGREEEASKLPFLGPLPQLDR